MKNNGEHFRHKSTHSELKATFLFSFHPVLRIRIRIDPDLLPGGPDPELKFRIWIQQKKKKKINKNVISNFWPVNSGADPDPEL